MRWQVATQLHPGATPLEFTAPNLQYLMDSPSEFGPVRHPPVHGRRRARSGSPLHHTGTAAELDGFVKDVEKIVRQEGAIYGEYPEYEPGYYTFLADYLPYANGDGMEHRNSTVITAAGIDRRGRARICSTRSRTSSSTAGTSSASGRRGSSRSISIARTSRASCGWPKASRSTTVRWRCSARSSWTSRPRARTFGRPRSRRVARRPGPSRALGRRDEPHGAVHRRRPHRSIAPTGRTRSSRTTRSAARSRWRSI